MNSVPRLIFRNRRKTLHGNSSPLWIGIDVGGTKVAAICADKDGQILKYVKEETRKQAPEALMQQLIRIVDKALGQEDKTRLAGVGIGLPGQVDSSKGSTYSPFNLGWPEEVDIRSPIEAAIKAPVYIDNDLNTAILAEWSQGIGNHCTSFCYVTIGTGVAAGLVLEGKLYKGAHYLAGELGHLIVDPTARACKCGTRGCLEELVSGPGLVKSYREKRGPKAESCFKGAEAVFSAARKGEPEALEVIKEAAKYLAIGLSNLAVIFDPEVITIGGGISESGDVLFEELENQLSEWQSGVVDKQVRIVPATHRSYTGVIGACLLAHEGFVLHQDERKAN